LKNCGGNSRNRKVASGRSAGRSGWPMAGRPRGAGGEAKAGSSGENGARNEAFNARCIILHAASLDDKSDGARTKLMSKGIVGGGSAGKAL